MQQATDTNSLSDAIAALRLTEQGTVYLLVNKPLPGVHEVVPVARVSLGVGFDADHDRKAYYRGVQMPGRQVSAVTSEFCSIVGVDPVDIGDNIVTRGIDLRLLKAGDQLTLGSEVILERTTVPHKPCLLFAERAGRMAYDIAKERNWRGALFDVIRAGTVATGDAVRVIKRSSETAD